MFQCEIKSFEFQSHLQSHLQNTQGGTHKVFFPKRARRMIAEGTINHGGWRRRQRLASSPFLSSAAGTKVENYSSPLTAFLVLPTMSTDSARERETGESLLPPPAFRLSPREGESGGRFLPLLHPAESFGEKWGEDWMRRERGGEGVVGYVRGSGGHEMLDWTASPPGPCSFR